jgi:hypothetical protein
MQNEPDCSEGEFEYYIKRSGVELDAQFEIVLDALARLAECDAAEADPADFERIRQAAITIGQTVHLDRRVQHQV